jgi:hypothetical protein
MRYIVMLDGKEFSDLYFNMRGYRGYLPVPEGGNLDLGEKSIGAYRAQVKRLNREFRTVDV